MTTNIGEVKQVRLHKMRTEGQIGIKERVPQKPELWPWICVLMWLLSTTPNYYLLSAAETPDGGPPPSNGIEVGRAKVFDNRTLTLMLEAWTEQLRNKQFVDVQKLSDALGKFQGYRLHEFSSSLSVTTPTIPGTTREATDNFATALTATGASTNQSLANKTTTTNPAYTPTAPTLDALNTTIPTMSYSESAGDLLSDQVSLTYQIMNLRMLLERSLSDRLLANGKPRLQAVIGFNITLNPPRIANNAVAVVEVTLQSESSGPEGVSVVAMMPQEKTYNAQSLSTKANAFGAAAVAKVVQVSYNQKSKDQTYFLYRDNDTVAFERPAGATPNSTTFGWMFRPVLGRPSVATENRQLFAVVALPDEDSGETSAAERLKKLKVCVKTYWRRFDSKTMTSFSMEDANRRAQVLYALTLNLAKPRFFDSRFTNEYKDYELLVPSTLRYQENLEPGISDISWMSTGAKSALVTVVGTNLFSGTKIALGDKILTTPEDGLVVKSDRTLEFTTTPEAIALSEGAIIGRYGNSVPLKAGANHAHTKGVAISQARLGPQITGSRQLDVFLQGRSMCDTNLSMSEFPRGGYVLLVNNTAVPVLRSYDETSTDTHRVVVQAMIPATLIKAGVADVRIVWPFQGDLWASSTHMTDPETYYKIVRFSKSSILVTAGDSAGFRDPENPGGPPPKTPWTLQLADTLISLMPPKTGDTPQYKALSSWAALVTIDPIPEKAILTSPVGTPFILDIPKADSSSTNAEAEAKPVSLNQNDSLWKEIAVADAKRVEKVIADTEELELNPATPADRESGGKKIKVHFTRKITTEPGKVDVKVVYSPSAASTNIPPSFVTVEIAPVVKTK